MLTLNEADVPCLPRGVRIKDCPVRNTPMLLAPERAIPLDRTGAAIIGHVDGQRSIGRIVDRLVWEFTSPRDRILEDSVRFLSRLAAARIVDLK